MSFVEKTAVLVRLARRTVLTDRLFSSTLALGMLGVLVSAVKPWIAGGLIDGVVRARAWGYFWEVMGAGAGAFLVSELMSSGGAFLGARLNARTTARFHRQALKKVYHAPFVSASPSAGRGMHSVLMDSAAAAAFSVSASKDAAVLAFKVALSLALVSWLAPGLAALALALSATALLALSRPQDRLLERQRARDEMEQDAYARLSEDLAKLLAIKSMRAERRFLRMDFSALARWARAGFAFAASHSTAQFASELAFKAAVGVVSLYGLYRVRSGRMSAGSLAVVMGYLTQLLLAQRELAGVYATLPVELLARSGALEEPARGVESRPRGGSRQEGWKVAFAGVCFGYAEGRPVFDLMSFQAGHGEHTVLAGPSGCGKTTAMFLAAGLLHPARGTVSLGGRDVASLSAAELRGQAALVLQEPLVWDASVEDNIRFWSRGLVAEDFDRAVRAAGVDELCAGMLGGSCRGLSRGQKQRVALARALVLRPRLLLLDEALSSLEPEAERAVMERVRQGYPEATVLSVSHRPAAMAADRILWMRSPSEAVSRTPAEMFADTRFAAIYDSPGAA